MKNTKSVEKKMKSLKVSCTVLIITLILTLAGVITEFVQTGVWSGEGCSLLAAVCALICVNCDSYSRCRKEADC